MVHIGRDVENGLVDTAGVGMGGTNWESRISICILPCVKQVASGKRTGLSSVLCSDLEGWNRGWTGGPRRGDICYTYG